MLKIVFMGTPEFAVSSLDAINKSDHKIVAAVTVPDKPKGRGQKLGISAVKEYCNEHNIKIYQPAKLKDLTFIEELKALQADLFVVVAFRMLPEAIWKIPPKGTINLHASLLPKYRGAAPINWAIINGDTESGVTTFFINENIDTGDIIQQTKIKIGANDDCGVIHDKMKEIGALLLVDTLNKIDCNKIEKIEQTQINNDVSFAPKLTRENTAIKWDRTANEIINQIRGLSPYPCAWTQIKTKKGELLNIKIAEAEIAELSNNERLAGEYYSEGKDKIIVQCKDSAICLKKMQLSGKKMMKTDDLLRGYSNEFVKGRFF